MSDPGIRPPVPPFTEETARQKVQAAEDAWNTRDPERVALAYTDDSEWRNRDEFFQGRRRSSTSSAASGPRSSITGCERALVLPGNRISVRFEYECVTPAASGGEATATSTGSSTTTARCVDATPASTTTGSRRANGASTSTGHEASER